MVVCLVLHLSMFRVKSREFAHARQKYAMWKENGAFLNFLYTCQLSIFRPIV